MELTIYITLTIIAIIVFVISIACDLYMRAYLKKKDEKVKEGQFAEFTSWNDGERILLKLDKIVYVEEANDMTAIDCGYDVARRERRIYYVKENYETVISMMGEKFEISRLTRA